MAAPSGAVFCRFQGGGFLLLEDYFRDCHEDESDRDALPRLHLMPLTEVTLLRARPRPDLRLRHARRRACLRQRGPMAEPLRPKGFS
jgi:hypothetical protein